MTRTNRSPAGKINKPAGTTGDVLLLDKTTSLDSAVKLLTISEVAEFLKISASGVRRLQQQRQIPFIKVGGGIRFAEGDLVTYLEKQRVESIG